VTNSLTGGGAERAINLVSDELWSRGLDIALIAINEGPEDLVISRAKRFPLRREKGDSFRNELRTLREFLKITKKRKGDIFVLNCNLPELYGIFLPLHSRIVVVEHANPSWHYRKLLGLLVRWILFIRRATWVKVSDHLTISNLPKVNAVVINNPISENFTFGVTVQSKPESHRLAYVGRLESYQKRPEIVLELARRNALPAIFIGDGPEKEFLTSRASLANLEVKFLGHISDPWVHLTYLDLLVVPSAFEGDGLVAVEAILRNQPLLLSDIPDFRRFQLPDRNYFKDLDQASLLLKEFSKDYTTFIPPSEVSEKLRSQRSIFKIGDDWIKLIHKLS